MKKPAALIPESTKKKICSSTLNFLFIILYVNVFQRLFGAENSIVGVIFTIMMSASMVRDLTAHPFKHFVIQSLVLVLMALSAFGVTVLPAPMSFLVNFFTLLVILYSFTYEYSTHLYFPYILSYLFLIFISPIRGAQLPSRLLGMLAGALSIILYQLFMGRKRIRETARDVLGEMIDEICLLISARLEGAAKEPDLTAFRHKLYLLSQTIYDRRKKIFCISEAGFSMLDAGRGLERLCRLIYELPQSLSEREQILLSQTAARLQTFHSYLRMEIPSPIPEPSVPLPDTDADPSLKSFEHTLSDICDRILHMSDPKKRIHYRQTALSFKIRFLAALDFSPVRAVYAVRTALLLALATALVKTLALPHGKWLLFTLASVSLPYADDVPGKLKKRILATITGGLTAVVIYSLVPSAAFRTIAMMLSGYISFYFSDYAKTFACSTVGALGGAVIMDAFGFQAVSRIFLIRLTYILIGSLAAYLLNCLVFPYSRAKATRQLWKKYKSVTELLRRICSQKQSDPQLYYSLVIQGYLLEERLTQNATLEEWENFPKLLEQCRRRRHSYS